MESAGAPDPGSRDRGEGTDAPDLSAALDALGYTNKAELGTTPTGLTTFSPGSLLGGFPSYSSPQGLLGLFGQWGPFAGNNYGSWSNVSLGNVMKDLGALSKIGMSVPAGPLSTGLAIGTSLPGLLSRNQGAFPSPGGVGGQSYDPSAAQASLGPHGEPGGYNPAESGSLPPDIQMMLAYNPSLAPYLTALAMPSAPPMTTPLAGALG